MNIELETFNYFVDDLLSSDTNLLKYELDLLLMQYIFNSMDLEGITNMDIEDDICFAS